MKKQTKLLMNFALFMLLIVLTFYILLKDQNIFEVFDIIKSAKLEFILLGILCVSIYVICEAVNISRTLTALGEKSTFINNIKYALIGFFFSAITPAASGGQPMQIYYMHKNQISVANSTLALLINLTSMQIVTIGLALFSIMINYQYMNKTLIILFIVGILLNLTALTLLLVGIFSKKLSRVLINFAIKILRLFRIRNIEDKKKKLEETLTKYQNSADYIKNNKRLIFRILLTTLVQYIAYYSVTYCTYRALGFKEHNIIEIVTMQAVLYGTVSGIPSPGAVGVTEGAFIEIFRNIYPQSMIKSAVLLNRGINFYLLNIVCGTVTILNQLKTKSDIEQVD
ncbi:putative uncharacterized protein [Clostridium sp. CAG:356]|nr:putative uncharacterized protein [Clostridium sp. CAG:356]